MGNTYSQRVIVRNRSAASRPISKADYEALAGFRYALRHFLHFSESAACVAGLTPQQHQALLAIKGYPVRDDVSVRELADHLLLRHHSVVELVNRLARLGLVHRKADPNDGRRVLVGLTAKAEQVLARLSTAHLDETQRLEPSLAALLERFDER
jgi:DNA-binding MarR family transcriptional regulator